MNNVENRVVEMKFDNAQFEQAVAQTMSTLDKFKNKLNFEDAGKGVGKLKDVTGNYNGILGTISSAIDSVAEHFSNLSGVGGRVFNALTTAAQGFLTSGLNKLTSDIVQGGQSRAMNLEQAKFQLEGILGSAQEVNRVIYDDILPELQGTPFSLDQAAVVMGQLAASGKTASAEVQQGTRAIAGAAAMTNSSFADMGRIFTKVAGNGRVMGDTLQEMSSRGLNAAADMGKVFDMTEAEVREAVTAGQISYDMFAQAMDELYGDQAKKSTTMYTGALEDLRAALARIGAEPMAVKLEFLRDAFNALVPAVDAVNSVLKPFTSSSKALVEAEDGTMQYAKEFNGTLAKRVQEVGWSFQSLFVTLDDNHDILRYNKDNWKELGLEMEKDEDGLKHYYETLKDGTKVEREFGEAVMNPAMYRIMTAAAQSFVNVVAALGKVLGAVGQGILAAFPKLSLNNIANFVEGIRDFTHALILSEGTLQNIKFVVQAVFTPLGLLVRILITAAKVLIEFGKIVYHALAPTFKVITSMAGAAAGIFSGLGKAVDNATADITGMARRLYDAAKSFAQFLHLDKLIGHLKSGLEKLSSVFTKVGVNSYNFLSKLSENAKKAGAAIYSKLRIDEFAKKLETLKTRLKAALTVAGNAIGFDRIVAAFTRLKDAIKGLFSTSLSIDKVGSSIKDFGSKLLAMIPTDKILNAMDRFADYLVRIIYAVAGFVGPKIEAVIDFFSRIGQSLVRLFNTIKLFVKVFGILDTIKLGLFALSQVIPRLLGFKSFGDILDTIKDKIQGFVQVFKTFLEAVIGGTEGNAKRMGQNMKNGLNNLVDDKISGKVQKFGGVMKAFGEIVGKIAGGIGDKLRDFYKALEEGDKKKIIASLSLLVIAFSYLKTIHRVGKTVKSVRNVFEAFSGIGEGIKNIGNSFKDAGKAIKRITTLIGVTTSLLIFAAALSLLGRMDMDTLVQGGIAAIGSLIALSISLALLNAVAGKEAKGADKIMKLGAAMTAIGAAIYLISKSMQNLSEIYQSNGVGGYLLILATVGAMLVAFGILAKQFSKMEKMEVSLKSAGVAMLAISTAIKMMVGSMQAIGSMDTGTLIKGGGAIVILLGLMTALSYFAGKNDNVSKAATALAKLTTSLLVLRLALGLFASMDLGTFIHGLIFMGATLAALLGVMSLFGSVAGPKQAGGIIAIAVAVGVLAGALLIMSAIPFGSLIKSILALVLAFGAIAVVMALFSAVGIGMLVVAGAFALLGVAMLFVGGGALALALALSMLVPLFLMLSAVPTQLVKDGLEVLGVIAEGLKLIFFDLAKGVLAFGGALLVAAIAAVILGIGVIAIGAGLVIAGLGLLVFAGGIAVLALTIQALFGGDFLSGIGEGLSNFGSLVTSGLSGIADKVKGIFSKDKGKEATTDYLEGGKESVEEASPGFMESFSGVLNDMKGSADGKSVELKDTMKNLMSSGGEGITDGTPALTDAFGGGLDQLKTIAGGKSGDISSVVGKIPKDAGGAISKNSGKYSTALKSMFDSGAKATKKSSDDSIKKVKDNAKQMATAVGDPKNKAAAEKANKDLVNSSKKAYKNLGKTFKGYGNDAAVGFAAGIRAKSAEAAREAARMVRNAMNAAKNAQDSNSPSKEFAKFGRWADEGYIIGLKSLSGKVSKAAEDMVGGGINAVQDAMSYIASATEFDDFNPTITPVVDLTNVDQSVDRMGTMFDSAFGVTTPFGSMNAAFAAQSFADSRNQNAQFSAINKLASKIDSMTDAMNSRSLNNYITVDGASDPEEFADGLIRSFRLNARTV